MVVVYNKLDLNTASFGKPIEYITASDIMLGVKAKHQASTIIYHDQMTNEFKILKSRVSSPKTIKINKYNKGVLLDLLLNLNG